MIMCLFTQTNEMKVAENDITCYKILYYIGSYAYKFASPYQNFKYDLIRYDNYAPTKFYETTPAQQYIRYDWNYALYEGVFHSYKYLGDAKDELFGYFEANRIGTRPCIVECIIPKGTEYIEGDYSAKVSSYASKSIELKKMIVEPKKIAVLV